MYHKRFDPSSRFSIHITTAQSQTDISMLWRTKMALRVFGILLLLTIPIATQKQSGKDNWPSFRGDHAAGVADGQNLPESWDGEKGTAIIWKTNIPGLAHSSPVVWGDRIFVTTAISSRGVAKFKSGMPDEASDDRSVHQWKVYCLDKKSGKVVWDRTAYEGPPVDKRHIKSTYASSTPATDGRYVVALFGSQGLYAFNIKGRPAWKKDLGRMDTGAYDVPDYEWGPGSSPIIYKDLVIVQVDQQKGSFLIAVNIKNGETVWKIDRDEPPSWGTPAIYPGKGRVELVTNGSKFIRGYDPETGKELWRYQLSCYDLATGEEKYTERIPHQSGGFTASPVASDGKIYLPSEDGDIFVVRAGPKFELLGKNGVGQLLMATPAISGGMMFVRAERDLFAIGR